MRSTRERLEAGRHYFGGDSQRKRSRHGTGNVPRVDRGRRGHELVHFGTEMLYTHA